MLVNWETGVKAGKIIGAQYSALSTDRLLDLSTASPLTSASALPGRMNDLLRVVTHVRSAFRLRRHCLHTYSPDLMMKRAGDHAEPSTSKKQVKRSCSALLVFTMS